MNLVNSFLTNGWKALFLQIRLLEADCGLEQLSVEASCSCFSGCLVFSGVTWPGHLMGKRGGSHLNRQACHLPSCPSALTAPDQAPPVDRQHISMYHCLARRLLSSTASLSTFLGGKEVLIAANHRRFASTGSVRDYFIFFPAELTPPLLQSRNHAWPGSQAWGCRPKLLHRWQIYASATFIDQ